MMRRPRALALSTLCFLLAASACTPTPHVETRNIAREHPDWFVCEKADGSSRPAIPAEYTIDWSTVLVPGNAEATLERAKAEQAKYVASIRDREGVIVGYIQQVEGVNFVCWNNMQTQRDFYARLPTVR